MPSKPAVLSFLSLSLSQLFFLAVFLFSFWKGEIQSALRIYLPRLLPIEWSHQIVTAHIYGRAPLYFLFFFFCLALSNRVIVTDGSFPVCVTFSQEYFVHSLLNVAGVVPFFSPPSDR
jgi:hypothetical protein